MQHVLHVVFYFLQKNRIKCERTDTLNNRIVITFISPDKFRTYVQGIEHGRASGQHGRRYQNSPFFSFDFYTPCFRILEITKKGEKMGVSGRRQFAARTPV